MRYKSVCATTVCRPENSCRFCVGFALTSCQSMCKLIGKRHKYEHPGGSDEMRIRPVSPTQREGSWRSDQLERKTPSLRMLY